MAVKCLNEAHGDGYVAYQGDCVDVLSQMPSESIDFSIYSPPFGNLFIYSSSAADMGNSATDGEFEKHYAYEVIEKFRLTKPGRLSAVHCSDLPMTKWRDGEIAIKDFSGAIIRIHEAAGWVLHSRVTIWKCPVVEMTRTKAHGLLYKTLRADSSRSRQGMPDYLLVFRKPGINAAPIVHTPSEFPLALWQEIASPVWMTVHQGRTLNVEAAKEMGDERHLCPLQLDVIERGLRMWSNPDDVVMSPFMGIGSEGWCSLRARRRFIGVELKETYWRHACRNLDSSEAGSADLFEGAAA